MKKFLTSLPFMIIGSALLILLGIIYFTITVWIIKIAAGWAGLEDIASNTIVLTAGIVTAASMLGSALKR